MSSPATIQVVELLGAAQRGSRAAMEKLLPVVYDELRRLASRHLRGERADHTLEPTALVHEAYLRLIGQHHVAWRDRAHFFGAASTVMRRVLVDHARAKKSNKRGGGAMRTRLDAALASFEERSFDLVALNDALHRLSGVNNRLSRVVEMRFFGGLSMREISEVLEVPIRTIERDWTFAKAWLRGQWQET